MFTSLTDLMPKEVGSSDDDSDKKATRTPNDMAKEILEEVMDTMAMPDRIISIMDITDIIPADARNPY